MPVTVAWHFVDQGQRHGADDGVQARAIAPAGEDADVHGSVAQPGGQVGLELAQVGLRVYIMWPAS
jgi:hypothetical protein